MFLFVAIVRRGASWFYNADILRLATATVTAVGCVFGRMASASGAPFNHPCGCGPVRAMPDMAMLRLHLPTPSAYLSTGEHHGFKIL
jgi:hypothetical protein